MLQAFIIVLREGFEAFLIVAITAAYLRKTGQSALLPSVYWGIAVSVIASVALGYFLYQGANGPLLEGTFALIAAVLITWLVVHMWRLAPRLKKEMEMHLAKATEGKTSAAAYAGVFFFTVLMIAREGMETALLLLQIHEAQIVTGALLGALGAVVLAILWLRYSYLINLKLFFQGTAIFLLFFVVQVLLYSFHEFTEAGIFPNSDYWHAVTEPYSADGLYGKWFSTAMVAFLFLWLGVAWFQDKMKPRQVKAAV
jgi:high-affinity iron transporter